MPFTTTSSLPSTSSPVTIVCAGLLLLAPDGANMCNIFVHRRTRDHLFQVMLIITKPNRPPITLRLLTGPLDKDFEIGLRDNASPDFKAFALGNGDIVRSPQTAQDDALDYRWVLNLKSLEDHADAQADDGAKPIVRLKTGVLYTPNLTKEEIHPRFVRALSPPIDRPLFRFAAELAVAIQATKEHPLRLSWSDLGDPQNLDVPRINDPDNTTYTVAIVNDPPISDPADHDEIARYYRVLTDRNGNPIPFEKRFQLLYGSAEKTDEIPCQPVTLEP
jgi:hypothetical protein